LTKRRLSVTKINHKKKERVEERTTNEVEKRKVSGKNKGIPLHHTPDFYAAGVSDEMTNIIWQTQTEKHLTHQMLAAVW